MNLSLRSLEWKARNMVFSPRVPFEVRSRLLYWEKRRSWPTRHPVTFSEKIIWKMVFDRRPLLTTFADKLAVRDYVADVIGPQVLSRLYDVVEDPEDLDLDRLPQEFVVKPSHASGFVWIVAHWAPDHIQVSDKATLIPSGMITTNRDALDRRVLVQKCREWLATSYADAGQEWAYRNVPPRILVEELLVGSDGGVPTDYKFLVFHGHVRFVEIHSNRFEGHCANYALPDWTPVDTGLDFPQADPAPAAPESLDRMIEIAEALGRDTDFVRVDLYEIAGRVVFGELTSYPGGLSARKYYPDSWGEFWNVPRRYRESDSPWVRSRL
jgi:hypothetical protein